MSTDLELSPPPAAATEPPGRPPLVPGAGYRGLRVWQRAVDLSGEAARLAAGLRAGGHDVLAGDLVRAAAAIPMQVAAGSVAGSRPDHQRALAAAVAAVARFETLVAVADRLAPLGADAQAAFLAATSEVTRQLRALSRAVGNGTGARGGGARSAAAGGPTRSAPPTGTDGADGGADDRGGPAGPGGGEGGTAPPEAPIAPPLSRAPARARRGRTATGGSGGRAQ